MDAPAPTGTRRVPLRWILRLAATAIALGLIAWLLPFGELWASLTSIPAATLPVAVIAYLLAHLVGVTKWRRLINAAGAGLAMRPTAQAYYWGLFGNLFLPSIVGGDVVRAGVAFRHARSGSALILGSLVDRVQDVIGLGVLAAAGALLSPRALDDLSRRVFITVASLMALAALVGLGVLWLFPVRLVPFRLRRRLVQVRRAIRAMAARPMALVIAFTLGLALQTALVAINWRLGHLIGIDLPFYVWLFAWPLAKLAGLTPLTQGGIGIREAAQAALLAPFGITAVKAVAAGLVFEAVLVSGGLVSGLMALLLRRSGTPASAPAGPAAGPA